MFEELRIKWKECVRHQSIMSSINTWLILVVGRLDLGIIVLTVPAVAWYLINYTTL